MSLEVSTSKEIGTIGILTGPTASGKSHVSSLLLEKGIDVLVSATTRKKRRGEKGGRDYHFITPEHFESHIKNGRLVEYNEYAGNYYGTLKSEVEKILDGTNVVTTAEIEGAVNFRTNLMNAYEDDPELGELLSSRLVPVFLGVKRATVVKDRFFRRAGDRSSYDPTKREDFLERARRDWSDWQKHGYKFDHVIINDGPIELAVDQVLQIINPPLA